MKKYMAIMAIMMILLCGSCLAEDGQFMKQLGAGTTYTVMTEESYPMVRISPYGNINYYIQGLGKVQEFVFPCPEGCYVESFEMDSAHFWSPDDDLDIWYQGHESKSYELFLNNCTNDQYILADGTGGVAAYINPGNSTAYALISLDPIKKGAKLAITIRDGSLSKRTEKLRADLLTTRIQSEIARVQALGVYEESDAIWTRGCYDAIELVSSWYSDVLVRVDLPRAMTLAGRKDPVWEISAVDSNTFAMYTVPGKKGTYAKAEFKLGTYSYLDYAIEHAVGEVETVNVGGMDYRICVHESGRYAYVDTLIATNGGYSGDQNYYLYIEFKLDNGWDESPKLEWKGMEDAKKSILPILENITYRFDPRPEYYEYPPCSGEGINSTAPAESTQGEEAFTFRYTWGMSWAALLQAEGLAAYNSSTYGVNDHIRLNQTVTTLSKFDVTGGYLFLDDKLCCAEYVYSAATDEDLSYLKGELTKAYGTPAENMPMDDKLAACFASMGGTTAGFETAYATWHAGDTVIQLFRRPLGGFDLFFADRTADVESVLVVPTATPAPAQDPVPAAFTFRNGLRWGMTNMDVLAAEGQEKYESEHKLVQVIRVSELKTTISKFDVQAYFYFISNGLCAAEFFYGKSSNADVQYLIDALSLVYGECAADQPVHEKLAIAITAARGSLNGYEKAKATWQIGDTVIQLFTPKNKQFDLFYADATTDIAGALATPTPEPININGL